MKNKILEGTKYETVKEAIDCLYLNYKQRWLNYWFVDDIFINDIEVIVSYGLMFICDTEEKRNFYNSISQEDKDKYRIRLL